MVGWKERGRRGEGARARGLAGRLAGRQAGEARPRRVRRGGPHQKPAPTVRPILSVGASEAQMISPAVGIKDGWDGRSVGGAPRAVREGRGGRRVRSGSEGGEKVGRRVSEAVEGEDRGRS